MLLEQPLMYISSDDNIVSIIRQMPTKLCKKFETKPLRDFPPELVSVAMRKNSEWYERINFAAIERISYIDDRPKNMSRECNNRCVGSITTVILTTSYSCNLPTYSTRLYYAAHSPSYSHTLQVKSTSFRNNHAPFQKSTMNHSY
jgi:hypothetical protein